MYQETLLTSMGMFGDKKGTFGDMYSSGLSFVKLLMDTLVTNRHIAGFKGQFGNKHVESLKEYHDLDPDHALLNCTE